MKKTVLMGLFIAAFAIVMVVAASVNPAQATRDDRSSRIIGPPDPIPGDPDPSIPRDIPPRPEDLPSCQEIECVPPDLPIKAR